MTTCAGVAPVAVASPLGFRIKRKRLQDVEKEKDKKSVTEKADALVERLLSEGSTTFAPYAIDRIKLREPTKKPRIYPKPSPFAGIKSMAGRIGSKIGKFAGGVFDAPPYPTAPEQDQLPIAPRALNHLNLIPDPAMPVESPDGSPRTRIAGVPSNPVRKVKPWTAVGKPSKSPSEYHPQRTWVKGKFNRNLHPRVKPMPNTVPKISKRKARRRPGYASRITGVPKG